MVRLKLISPRPVAIAPSRGNTGINQARSAAEVIRSRQDHGSVGNSAQQAFQLGGEEGRAADGDEAMGIPEHSHSDSDAELGRLQSFLP
ncbi:MAG: Uncharacterised protein [Prochlorococcus marinus str. MIT 9313]|nr:MAG: Uncharacterised protein [Prochlorococcus marinus str. MIT 9313]